MDSSKRDLIVFRTWYAGIRHASPKQAPNGMSLWQCVNISYPGQIHVARLSAETDFVHMAQASDLIAHSFR